MQELEKRPLQPKMITLPAAEEIYRDFEEQGLIGHIPAADSLYTALAGFLGKQEIYGKWLTGFFFLAMRQEQEDPDHTPAAVDFVLAHFDEFINAAVSDPQVASEAKRFMRQIQQIDTYRKRWAPPKSKS